MDHILEPKHGTVLPRVLVTAYLGTDYRVYANGGQAGFSLRVGQFEAVLLALMRQHVRHTAAYVTAFNPMGQACSDADNQVRNATLQEALSRRSLPHWLGLGQGTDPSWPGEESFLVLGLDLAAAQRLAQEFGQNALVWAGSDAVPRLVLLR